MLTNRHSRKSLKVLGTVGEPINPEAWLWYYHTVGDEKCAIVDTYWQTETVSTQLSSNSYYTIPGILYSIHILIGHNLWSTCVRVQMHSWRICLLFIQHGGKFWKSGWDYSEKGKWRCQKKFLVETIVATLNIFVFTTSVIYNWTDVQQKGICLLITLLLLLLFITFIYCFG